MIRRAELRLATLAILQAASSILAQAAEVRKPVLADCVLTNVAFPRGNLLVWVACLDAIVSEQVVDRHVSVRLDVGLPTISNGTAEADSHTAVHYLTTNSIATLTAGLQGTDPGLGLGIVHRPLRLGTTSLGRLLSLFDYVFRCRACVTGDGIDIGIFPENLVILRYRLNAADPWNSAHDLVVAYSGSREDPINGQLYYGCLHTHKVAYVIAPPGRHERALKGLAEIRSSNVAEPCLDLQRPGSLPTSRP